ncbi:PREDICTED: limbic system-associated membrane protein-like [Dinoponera quadriceps]|uniref:Limbic system-associated membrane protein-like n=1 Tax=Dinoponera quadriceps TaxID=609295 RepID=A0A6P3YGC4_DINQU|nr:PREDICTED: limbic system-associated membrane protein-like [Dinoponera quadriceps]
MMSYVWIFYICITGIYAGIRTNRAFGSHPATIKVSENDTVLLPCYVEDQGVQTRVRWWREEILLADSFEQDKTSSERYTVYRNGSLQILHIQLEDRGEYVCQAIRPAPWGYVTQVREIEVMYPPSIKTVPASGELEVNLGEEVDMRCEARGVPFPNISWRTKNEEIPLLDDRSQLKFHADNRNFSGRYTCVANNGVGDPAVAHIDLRIKYKPEIYVRKPWVHTYPGIRVKLDCTVTAWPEAEVEWYFKNETLKDSPQVMELNIGNDHSLIIKNVKTTDYGSYFCRASNILGTTEKTVELTAIANPAVFKKESRSTSNTSYNFIWEVDSYSPIIEYQFWFRKYKRDVGGKWHKLFIPDGTDAVSPVHTRSFNLTGLNAATHYEAVVLSRNRYGWSHPSEILHFHTEGASVGYSENLEIDDSQKQNRVPVVKLMPMSQHYPLAADTNGSCNQTKMLSLILSILCIIYLDYNVRQQI